MNARAVTVACALAATAGILLPGLADHQAAHPTFSPVLERCQHDALAHKLPTSYCTPATNAAGYALWKWGSDDPISTYEPTKCRTWIKASRNLDICEAK